MTTCVDLEVRPAKLRHAPLEEIELRGPAGRRVTVLDGAGDVYAEGKMDAKGRFALRLGGALGTHTVLVRDGETLLGTAALRVEAQTAIRDAKGVFGPLLRDLHLTMVTSCGSDGTQFVQVGGKLYHYFICWLRDHTHTMKGMKYFHADVKTGLELYADTQRADGMVYDRIAEVQSDAQNWRDHTFREGNFVRRIHANPDGTGTPYTLQRIPVENDVEYLFLECLYFTWKATGDSEWMKRHLDHALKAVAYATTDRYRWSRKFKLLKRGYTIDTWDFLHDDDGRLTLGDNVVDLERTTFGVMFGDNTGLAAGCRWLAEMLRVAGREAEAAECARLADDLLARLAKLAWNGRFYTHHVSEDPAFRRDVGDTDEAAQVTLSNAYSINRGIGVDKARAIIAAYKRIRQEMPVASPGEFYNCYPPFEKGFGKQDAMWQYMNGGVSTIVAGELARGAFCFGEEAYGADILLRIKALSDRHHGHLHVCFNGNPQTVPPSRMFSPVALANFANVTPEWRAEGGGWGDRGNDLSRLPRGRQVLAGIPFEIGAAGLGLAATRPGFARELRIPVGARHGSLYLLHTMDGPSPIAEMEIRYVDGEASVVCLEAGRQLDGWFMPNSAETHRAGHAPKLRHGWPEYQLAWQGGNDTFENVGVYVWGWDNPRPEAEIAEVVFRAARQSRGAYWVAALTGCDRPVWFPQSDLSFGIPDGWGAAAIVHALVEGLAGVVDTGLAFDRVEVSPRWLAVGEKKAEVVVTYEASGGYAAYAWERRKGGGHCLALTSSAHVTVVRLPIAEEEKPTITVNGVEIRHQVERVGDSRYAKFALQGKGVFAIESQV
jgi:hypothetical protein